MPALDIPFDMSTLENLPPFLRTDEVARLLRKSANAVVQGRYLHTGPPFIRDGRRILYDRDQVIDYLRQHTVQPDDPRPTASPNNENDENDENDEVASA